MNTSDNNSKSISWPRWLIESDDAIPPALENINKIEESLRAHSSKPFTYKRISGSQIIAFQNRMIAMGMITMHPDGTVTANRHNTQYSPSITETALFVYNHGQTYQMLFSYFFSAEIKMLKLLDGMRFGFASENFLVAFGCIRSIVEHISHYASTIKEINSLLRPPDNYNDALSIHESLSNKVIKKFLATRIDWEEIYRDSFATLKKNKIEYKKSNFRADILADGLIQGIDAMDKKVRGLRVMYEVLSDFVHPNIGTKWAITESVNTEEDCHGINWQIHKLGVGAPAHMIDSRGGLHVLINVLRTFAELLVFWPSLINEGTLIKERVLKVIQLIVKDYVTSYRDIFQRNDACPCGSGLKVKKCCGAEKKHRDTSHVS